MKYILFNILTRLLRLFLLRKCSIASCEPLSLNERFDPLAIKLVTECSLVVAVELMQFCEAFELCVMFEGPIALDKSGELEYKITKRRRLIHIFYFLYVFNIQIIN